MSTARSITTWDDHNIYHLPNVLGPVEGCEFCTEELAPDSCASCGASGEGVSLADYEDPGDPSVGYGPITEVLCDECAEHKGAS